MATASTSYPLGIGRRLILYAMAVAFFFPPVAILVAGLVEGKSGAIQAGLILSLILAPLAIFMAFLARWPRLIVRDDEVVVRGAMGFATQSVAWTNVERIIWKPGKQALLLREPMTSRAAANFRNYANMRFRWVPLYDDEQRKYILEQRYLPVAIFAHSFKHGDLLERIGTIAPRLAEGVQSQEGDYQKERTTSMRTLLTIAGVTTAAIAVAFALAVSGVEVPRQVAGVFDSANSGVMWLLALGMALYSAVNIRSAWIYARRRAYGAALLWGAMAVMQALLILVIFGSAMD